MDMSEGVTAELETAVSLLEEALFLCMNGERAPGGNETWREWCRKAEFFLRGRHGDGEAGREPSGGSPDSPPAGGAGLPGGSDDYLPIAAAGDDPGATWPVLPDGYVVAEVIDYPVIVFGPGGTAYIEPISEYYGKREAKAPS